MNPDQPPVAGIHKCTGCGSEGILLFYLSSAWKGGVCEGCGTGDPRFSEAFRNHFGTIVRISDGDAGKGHAQST